jgi:hypothetical protein
VTAGAAGDGLGETVSKQFGALPKAMMLASVMLLALGFVPGMPTVSFLVLGAGLGYTGFRLEKGTNAYAMKRADGGMAVEFVAVPGLELVSRTAGNDGGVRRQASGYVEEFAADSGIALPAWSFVGAEAEEGRAAYEIRRGGTMVAAGNSWEELEPDFRRNLLDYPGLNFGIDQMARWLQSVRKASPVLASSLVPVLQTKWANIPNAAPAQRLETQDCLVKLYQVLQYMVRERMPINDSVGIADYLISTNNRPTDAKADGLETMVNDIRKKVRANSMAFYRKWHRDLNPEAVQISQDSDLGRELERPGDQEAVRRVETRLKEMAKAKPGVLLMAVKREQRAHLWRVAQELFERRELDRPVLVLSLEELWLEPAQRALPVPA